MTIKELASKIPNYETMSEAEKLNAILALAVDDHADEIEKLKNSLNNSNSEAAKYKKSLAEKMTEAEKAEAERAEREKSIMEELETLRADKQISSHTAEFLKLGYPDELARTAAESLVKGDTKALFEAMAKGKTETDNKAKQSVYGNAPKPDQKDFGGNSKYKSKEDIMKIRDSAERQAAIAENPELFGYTKI